MASALNYTTQTDLENLLLVTIDPSFSTQIDTWISAAEVYINGYLGYTTASGLWNEQITAETIEARVDGDLNLVVYPRKRPINSVSQLQLLKGSQSITLSLTTSDSTPRYVIPTPGNVIVYPSMELGLQGSSVIRSLAAIKYNRVFTRLNYIAGYTSIPEDIELATTYVVADTFMRQANKEGLVGITQGRVSKRWREVRSSGPGALQERKSDYMLSAEDILNSYRIASGWW